MSAVEPSPAAPSPVVPRLKMLAAAALFSTGGTAIKLTTLTGMQVAALRSAVAALALVLLAKDARRGWTWRTLLVGLTSAITLTLFVRSNKLTTAANAIFLQGTATLWLLLLAPLLLREPVRRRDLGFLGLLAVGMALFFVGRETATLSAPDPEQGNLLAAISGLTWALTIAGLRWLARSTPGAGASGGGAVPATVAANALGFLLCAPFAFPLGSVTPMDVGAVLFLGVFQIALAYLFMTAAVRRVPAFEASLLLLLEPVLSALLAWLVHGEQPGAWSMAGCILILGATVGHAMDAARRVPTIPA